MCVIGPEKSGALLFFRSFTGCDVCVFRGKGKTQALQTWNSEVSRTFVKLSQYAVTVVLRSSVATNVNEAKLNLSACKQRTYGLMPSKSLSRCRLSGRSCLDSINDPHPNIKSSADYGWMNDGDLCA